MTGVVHDHLKHYAARVREQLRANADATDPALAPAFQDLVERLLPLLPQVAELTVSPEFRHEGVGRPDIALVRPGQPARAFIELKAPSKSADASRCVFYGQIDKSGERHQPIPLLRLICGVNRLWYDELNPLRPHLVSLRYRDRWLQGRQVFGPDALRLRENLSPAILAA